MSNYFNDNELEILETSDAYADYIMSNCGGDRLICNGDMLTVAMEDGYLFDEFITNINNTMECGEAYAFVRSQA